MIKVSKKINLEQLDKELNGLGLNASLDENREIIEVGLAENNSATEEELVSAIEAHVANAEKEPTEKERILSRLGLTEEEAKVLLG